MQSAGGERYGMTCFRHASEAACLPGVVEANCSLSCTSLIRSLPFCACAVSTNGGTHETVRNQDSSRVWLR
ncbi:hypothetical protein TGVEG_442110 [Toxoplasma gondii VEG]|uniref:Uncharacterized protein n=1 Tax=Toxoplasma gondii (strain ATCC 50861 / VEG) TaxID=432359 RepID=V4Z2J4_TOXGV|nr:hypothetical protein TGVEG_442110 [Toxoplasma gondii VEG]